MNECRCTMCDQVRPLDEFVRNRSKPTGYQAYCLICSRDQYGQPKVRARNILRKRRRHKEQPELIREETRRYDKRHPGARKATMQKRREMPEERARNVLRDAVRRGNITKPGSCEHCGKLCLKQNLHGHHPDHSKPLEVEWLCPACHSEEHRTAPSDAELLAIVAQGGSDA